MLTLIENVRLYDPSPLGEGAIVAMGGTIAHVGGLDREGRRAIEQLARTVDVVQVDGKGKLAIPGLIDPHEHLIGGSGEKGWATQTPEIHWSELVRAGITTVVGTLGVDTTTRTMPALYARAQALNDEGITALLWTGGYQLPPTTLLGGVREDIVYTAVIIGAGELAIADGRALEPSAREIARVVTDARIGGMLTGKAGVTHFHVGPGKRRLAVLRELLDDPSLEIDPAWLYPTHVERDEGLMREAVALATRGVTVDVDVIERDLGKWVRFFLDEGGDLSRLTASSDAGPVPPAILTEQLRDCVQAHGFTLEQVLPLVTSNTARVLRLARKGALRRECDADVVLLDAESLEVSDVFARGIQVVREGSPTRPERFLETSSRTVELHGRSS